MNISLIFQILLKHKITIRLIVLILCLKFLTLKAASLAPHH